MASKKSRLQDALVRYCIERDGKGKKMYVFTNDEVKKLSMPINFRNHNDATHIDTSKRLSPLMMKEDLGVIHLGTNKAVSKVAKHAFVRGSEALFHKFEKVPTEEVTRLDYKPGPLDELNTSESNILSIVKNHNILDMFLYPGDRRADPHMYMAHRTRVKPEYRIGDTKIPAESVQIEVDMTLEWEGVVTVFEAKNWSRGRDDFAIYQLYMPFCYYHQRMEKGEIDVKRIECCYVVRRKKRGEGSDIDVYLYTFKDPEDMTSISLVRCHRYELYH